MLIKVSIGIKHMTRKQLGLTCSAGSQGKNVEAETETAHGGMGSPAYSTWFAQFVFFI